MASVAATGASVGMGASGSESSTPLAFKSLGAITSLDRDYEVATPPYIITNESYMDLTAKTLAVHPCPFENPFHIGFSGWHNFDIVAQRRSCGALIADISTPVMDLFTLTKKNIAIASSREEFVELMLADFLKEGDTYFSDARGLKPEDIRNELTREGGWLADDESFAYIKDLYSAGKIIHIRLSSNDYESFGKIREWIRENDLHVDTVYYANIADWLFDEEDRRQVKVRLMGRAYREIAEDSTLVIDASDLFSCDDRIGSMVQRVFLGKDYDPLRARMKAIKPLD